MEIKLFINTIKAYFKDETEYFTRDKEQIDQKNINNLFFLSWVAMVSTILCILGAKIIIPNWRVTAYHISAVIFFLVFGFIITFLKNTHRINNTHSNLLCILFYIGMISVSIGICVFPYPNDPQVFVSLIYVIIPSILVMDMKTNLILITLSEIAFLLLAQLFKAAAIFRFDAFSTLTGVLFSVAVIYTVLSLRIQDYKNKEKYREISTRDSLCQIYNKKFFEIFSKKLLFNSKSTFALGIVDIDNFKAVNDNYGHKTGDNILVLLGDLLSEKLAQNGIVGRFGGDEFCAITEFSGDISCLTAEIEDFQKAFRKKTQAELGKEICFSVGIAINSPNSDTNYESMFVTADKALYIAKNKGKGTHHIEHCK